MKRIGLFLLLALSLTFVSCEKRVIEPNLPVEEQVTSDTGVELFGKWVLRSGKMYMENLDTGEKIVYDHFDGTQTVSSLRYGGAAFEFETIKVNVTSWTFIAPPSIPNDGEFWLDNDSIQPYGLYITESNWTITEHHTATSPSDQQFGGSARPISAIMVSSNVAEFTVQEAYESIGGENFNYHSVLTFEKIN